MGVLLTLPVGYENGSLSPTSWPGGSGTTATFSNTSRVNLGGNTSTDNGQTLGSTVDPGGGGSIYSTSGFESNVQTKSTSYFYSKHFIGHINGNTISRGSSISSTTQSSWTQNVIGFHCEISDTPTGGGDEADGCGKVNQFRVCAVYADSSSKVRIMEMTAPGIKISSQGFQSSPGPWRIFSYSLNSSDAATVINGGWALYGWIIEFRHQKTCGGSNKQKNCTGRVRYMRPLVSKSGSLGSSYSESQIILASNVTLRLARSGSDGKSIRTL